MSSPPTILVFDSGLGGLTVLREIVRARPDAHYVYVADDAFFPYGHHSEVQIIARVVPLVGDLIARRASDLLGAPGNESDEAGAEMIFTSRRQHTLSQALMPFFGGRVPA